MPFFIAFFTVSASANPCLISATDKARALPVKTQALTIVDGDSLRYGQQKWRLVGINAPEYNEPLADTAKMALRKILQASNVVYWLQGEDPVDRYGRKLGYLFDQDGQYIARPLLRQGLAFAVAIAPNIGYLSCLQQSQDFAQQQDLGVWQHSFFAPISPGANKRTGFVRWQGHLQKVSYNKAGVWLEFDDASAVLHIPKSAQHYFSDEYFERLVGKSVVASGWAVSRRAKKGFAPMAMRIYHPLHITVLGQ